MNRARFILFLVALWAAPALAEDQGMLDKAMSASEGFVYKNVAAPLWQMILDWMAEKISPSIPQTTSQGMGLALTWLTILFLVSRLRIRWTSYWSLFKALVATAIVPIVLQRYSLSWVGWPLAFATVAVAFYWQPIQPRWLTLLGYCLHGWRPGLKDLWDEWWKMPELAPETALAADAEEADSSVQTISESEDQATSQSAKSNTDENPTAEFTACPHCGGRVRAGKRFCLDCQKPIERRASAQAKAVPRCAASRRGF